MPLNNSFLELLEEFRRESKRIPISYNGKRAIGVRAIECRL